MGENLFVTLLGLIPFLLMLFALWIYIVCRSTVRQINFILLEIRNRLRSYQQNALRLAQESSTFSPNDPEPYGELSENFNLRMLDFEKSLISVYGNYGGLHQRVNILRSTPSWTRNFSLFRWNALKDEAEKQWFVLEKIEDQYLLLVHSSDKIKKLGFEISRECLEVIEKLNNIREILHNLQPRITGSIYQVCERNVRKWDETLKTQIPVSFLTVNENIDVDILDKDKITKVHRILLSATPEISALYEKVLKWQSDTDFVITSMSSIKEKQNQLVYIMEELETKTVSPIQWDVSRAFIVPINNTIGKFKKTEAPFTIEDLREITHNLKRVTAQQADLESNCFRVQDIYRELMQLWSSLDLQQGPEWISDTKKVLDAATDYDDINWQSIDYIKDFRSQVNELAQTQTSLLPRHPVEIIRESEIEGVLDNARKLLNLQRNLRSRFKPINDRFKTLQALNKEAKEKLVEAKSVLGKTLPVIFSNPILKKNFGKDAEKLQASLELLMTEIDAKEGVFEKKTQKVENWITKSELAINKWLQLLAGDLDAHLINLGETFQTLGYFLNIQDLVITEAREILKKVEKNDGSNFPLFRPGDSPLLVASKKLWATNDDWQKVFSVERALMDVTAPVIERIKKVERSRETAIKQLERGDAIIPAVLQWPPTTQYLGSERKQFQNLETNWQSLRQENIQAIQLVGKLSDLAVSYIGVAAQISQKVEKAEQEQNKIKEYERKLDESKRLWLGIVERFPEYKNSSK